MKISIIHISPIGGQSSYLFPHQCLHLLPEMNRERHEIMFLVSPYVSLLGVFTLGSGQMYNLCPLQQFHRMTSWS